MSLPSLPYLSRSLALAAVLLTGTAHAMAADASAPSASSWRDARQLVLVVTDGWDATTGTLQRFEVREGRWQAVAAAAPIAVGRNGAAWGLGLHPAQAQGPQKREGDGRAPAGVFTLGEAFGYAAKADTAMPYRAMQATSYCIDVPDSPLYNRIIDTRTEGEAAAKGSTEPMRLDLHNQGDIRYREGLVIGHNPKATPRAGSCIFAHLWRTPGEPTAGCTAMASETMDSVLAWLRPDARPVFVLLPRVEYARLAHDWQLPEAAR
ncbi:L,D-transpeptidase family protein [Pseudoxanthomonas japonensis]|uniref:L,D-transpeptidase family protein n=1 Tax=Pseudoxanthomonas japonensis TaxID=69284 RepID=UPI001BD04D9B